MSQIKIPMTKPQAKLFNFMQSYYDLHGQMPLQREMAENFKCCKPTIQFHLKGLEKRGWIRRIPGETRAIGLSDSLHSSD